MSNQHVPYVCWIIDTPRPYRRSVDLVLNQNGGVTNGGVPPHATDRFDCEFGGDLFDSPGKYNAYAKLVNDGAELARSSTLDLFVAEDGTVSYRSDHVGPAVLMQVGR